MEISLWAFILSIIIVVGGWLATYFGFQIKVWKAIADLRAELTEKITIQEKRFTKWESRFELIWKPIEAKVIDILKSYPSRIDKDVLMDKFYRRDITVDEAETLWTILCEEEKLADSNKRLYYGLLQSVVADWIRQQGGEYDMVDTPHNISDQCSSGSILHTQNSNRTQGR